MKKKMFDPEKWVKAQMAKKKIRIVFITGGSKQCLAKQLASQPDTIVIAIDCEEELAPLKDTHNRLGIIQFSLGTRESLATLSEGEPYEIQETIAMVATMLAREGCGASPMAGYLAAERLVRTEHFVRAFEEIIDAGLDRTGGCLELIEVLFQESYVGGVGAGAVIPLVRFTQEKLSPLDVPVRIIIDALGPMTFKGVSTNAGKNAAPTLGHLILLAIDQSNPQNKRMSIRLNLAELPPLGHDSDTRSSLLQLDEEAIRSQEIQGHLTVDSPNNATEQALGNISSSEKEFFPPLEGSGEVLESAAIWLSDELGRGRIEVSNESLVIVVPNWQAKSQPSERMQLEELLSRMNEFTPNEFIQAVSAEVTQRFTIWR